MSNRRVIKMNTPEPLLAIPLGIILRTFGVSDTTVRKAIQRLEIPIYRNWPLPWKNGRRKFLDARDLWQFHNASFFPHYIECLHERYPQEAERFTHDKLYPTNEEKYRAVYPWLYTVPRFFETVSGRCDIRPEEIPDLLFCGAIPYYQEPKGTFLIKPFWVSHILVPGHPTGDYIGYSKPLD